MGLATIEAVTKYRFPDAKVQVTYPYEYDRVDIFILYSLRRGKRQHTMRYGRFSISGIIMHRYQDMLPKILPVELEHLAKDMDEVLEKARLVGWKRS